MAGATALLVGCSANAETTAGVPFTGQFRFDAACENRIPVVFDAAVYSAGKMSCDLKTNAQVSDAPLTWIVEVGECLWGDKVMDRTPANSVLTITNPSGQMFSMTTPEEDSPMVIYRCET